MGQKLLLANGLACRAEKPTKQASTFVFFSPRVTQGPNESTAPRAYRSARKPLLPAKPRQTPAKTRTLLPQLYPQIQTCPPRRRPHSRAPSPSSRSPYLSRPRAPSPKGQPAMDVNEEAMAAHKRAFLDFLDQDVSPLAVPNAAAAGLPGSWLTLSLPSAGREGRVHAGRPRHGPEQAPPPHHRHGRPPQPQPRFGPQVPAAALSFLPSRSFRISSLFVPG